MTGGNVAVFVTCIPCINNYNIHICVCVRRPTPRRPSTRPSSPGASSSTFGGATRPRTAGGTTPTPQSTARRCCSSTTCSSRRTCPCRTTPSWRSGPPCTRRACGGCACAVTHPSFQQSPSGRRPRNDRGARRQRRVSVVGWPGAAMFLDCSHPGGNNRGTNTILLTPVATVLKLSQVVTQGFPSTFPECMSEVIKHRTRNKTCRC